MRDIQRTKSQAGHIFSTWAMGLLTLVLLPLMPGQAFAESTCNTNLQYIVTGPDTGPWFLDDVLTVQAILGAGTIKGGNWVDIPDLGFGMACEEDASGLTWESCNNVPHEITFLGNITPEPDCLNSEGAPILFPPAESNKIELDPLNGPLRIQENESCMISWDFRVDGLVGEVDGTERIHQVVSFPVDKLDNPARCDNNLTTGEDRAGYIDIDTCGIELEKQVCVENCDDGGTWYNADSAGSAPSLLLGGTASYRLLVQNTGTADFVSPIAVTDSALGINTTVPALQSGQQTIIDGGTIEELNSSTRCQQLGSVENIANVQGFCRAGNTPYSKSAQDSAFLNCRGIAAVDIQKYTNGEDADSPTGPDIPVGDPVNWTYVVSNIGDVALDNIVVTDTEGVSVSCPQSSLPIGGMMTCTGNGIAVKGQYSNTGIVNANSSEGPVNDSDLSHYFGTDPSIMLEKTGTLNDDDGTDGVSAGDSISYAFTVTNTGNVTLTNVTVTDPKVTVSGGPIPSLAPGASDSTTFTAPYIVQQADIDAGTFTNIATATGQCVASGCPVSDPDDDTQLLGQAGLIHLEKTGTLNDDDGTDGVSAGDSISYAFTVTNTGNVTLTDVTVTDPKVTVSGGPIPSLAPGASDSTTFTATYIVQQADIDAGAFTNIATATGQCVASNCPVSDPDDDTQLLGQAGLIQLEKTGTLNDDDGTDGVSAGDSISYAFTVTNTGNVTLTDVTVTDPEVSVSGGPIPSLAPGASDSMTFTATYIVQQADIDAGTFTNIATATGQCVANNCPVSDPDDDTQLLEQNPDIELLKTGTLNDDDGTDGVSAGDTISYVFIVTNTGNVTLTSVTVEDANPDVTVVGGPVASLAPGASDNTTFTVSYTLKQSDIDAGTFTNTATATGQCTASGCPVSDPDDDTQLLNQSGMIELEKTGSYKDSDKIPGVSAGDTIVYTFVVTNTGNVTLTDVTLTDPKITVNGGPIPSLAAGASDGTTFSGVYILKQADIDAGTFTNIATATGQCVASNCPVSDPDDHTQKLNQDPDIELVKTGTLNDDDGTDGVSAGDSISYAFTVTNTGNVTLTDVTVTDPLVGLSPIDCAPENNPIADMTPGETVNCTASYAITQADINAGKRENLATATGSSPGNTDDVTDSDPHEEPLAQDPSLEIEKQIRVDDNDEWDNDQAGPVATPSGAQYRILVTNTGNVDLNTVTLTDDKLSLLPDYAPYTFGPLLVGETATIDAGYWSLLNVAEVCTSGGEYINTATAVGKYGSPEQSTGQVTDSATLLCLGDPMLDLEKQVGVPNGQGGYDWYDADTKPGDWPVVDLISDDPTQVRYRFIVENTSPDTDDGRVDLYNLVLNDIQLGIVDYPIGTLLWNDPPLTIDIDTATEQNDLMVDECDTYGEIPNTALVDGESLVGDPAHAEDPAGYFCVTTPDIMVTKTVSSNGADFADSASGFVVSDVFYRIQVTNTGTAPLDNLRVEDVSFGPPLDTGNLLDGIVLNPGESITLVHSSPGADEVLWSDLEMTGFCDSVFEGFVNTAVAYGDSVDDDTLVDDDDTATFSCREKEPICDRDFGERPEDLELAWDTNLGDDNDQVIPPPSSYTLLVPLAEFENCPLSERSVKSFQAEGDASPVQAYPEPPDTILGNPILIDGSAGYKAGKIPPNIYLEMFCGDVKQVTVGFHGSCSEPLNIGDRFGPFTITGYKEF